MTSTADYSPTDTVRLARQMAREVGLEEPIDIVCMAKDDAHFNQLWHALLNAGDYNIRRTTSLEDLDKQLAATVVDFCVLCSCEPQVLKAKELCQKKKLPVLIFNYVSDALTGPEDTAGTIQILNGKLNCIPVSWNSLNDAIKKALRYCAVNLY